jgi:hypothetical protein
LAKGFSSKCIKSKVLPLFEIPVLQINMDAPGAVFTGFKKKLN